MVTYTEARSEFATIVNTHGVVLQLKYYNTSGSTVSGISVGYDDDLVLTQSGTTLFTSGMADQVGNTSNETTMLQQGRILQDDQKIYFNGAISLAGIWTVGIGSPASRWYAPVGDVASLAWDIGGQPVYKKAFVRALPNGSIYSA